MRKKASLTITGLLLAVIGIWFAPELLRATTDGSASASSTVATAPASPTSAIAVDTRVGFTSPRALQEHFEKHGREFGAIDQARYLRLAQELRDAAVDGSVREATRSDGVITRFDTRSGAFIAFHDDKSIRTFFKPNDGLRYFERQLDKEH